MESDDDEVGYKKPPRAHRWVKGESGNKNGRPRSKSALDPLFEVIDKGLMRTIIVQENAGRRRVTLLELILRQLMKHMAGQKRSRALRIWRKYEKYARGKPMRRRAIDKTTEWGEKEKQDAVKWYAEYLRRQDEAVTSN